MMSAAKLLSAVEPVIRYQRQRFRGAEGAKPGTVRYEQGIQQREDALHRLVDVWATGEAAASLGFAAARLFDELDPLEKQKTAIIKERGVQGGRAEMKALKESEQRAIELLRTEGTTICAAPNSKPIRWSNMCCAMPRPTCFAPPPSSGTPATAPT